MKPGLSSGTWSKVGGKFNGNPGLSFRLDEKRGSRQVGPSQSLFARERRSEEQRDCIGDRGHSETAQRRQSRLPHCRFEDTSDRPIGCNECRP